MTEVVFSIYVMLMWMAGVYVYTLGMRAGRKEAEDESRERNQASND
jgi:hypothetical protein